MSTTEPSAPSTTVASPEGHGPVELFFVALPATGPDPSVVEAIADLVARDTIDLVDIVIVAKDPDGDLTVTEYEDLPDDQGLPPLNALLSGLLAEDDIAAIAEQLDPGTSAALFVIEHVWARALADRLAASGGRVITTERIPAPVVNELVAILEA
ncbi:conserved hypothetical protein [Nostocoides japonicum T1-X7]|uniref:DUF1269 domain-containing protein n=1 Tax=Nostocoides japonicum T1-X7 TaxID=1194083 RepID=A0A077M086_9MICO|nr:DUF6325 family protein [Tetrasphaera japonica]CCH77634.1 conserved hypothetical protein [Tetrasphaera japonica T1-X7]